MLDFIQILLCFTAVLSYVCYFYYKKEEVGVKYLLYLSFFSFGMSIVMGMLTEYGFIEIIWRSVTCTVLFAWIAIAIRPEWLGLNSKIKALCCLSAFVFVFTGALVGVELVLDI